MKAIPPGPPPQRILIIKPSAIGDVVHGLVVLAALRRRFPAAEIGWLVTPACAGIVEGHPMLDEVIRFDRRRYGRAWKNPAEVWRMHRFFKELRRRRFDWVVDLQGLFRSGYIAWRSGAPVRVGFANAREMGWMFYTHRVELPTGEMHAVDRYSAVATAMGCDGGEPSFPMAITEADRAAARTLAGGMGRYAVLLPGTNWATKRWPAERFGELVRPLGERFGLSCVLAGSPDERELCERALSAAAPAAGIAPPINLAGATTLARLAALIESADLVIANDSGPMHMAVALGRPLVTLFGPTNPNRTGPHRRPETVVRLDVPCGPCYRRTCSHQSCLRWLGIEPVLAVAARELARAVDPRATVLESTCANRGEGSEARE